MMRTPVLVLFSGICALGVATSPLQAKGIQIGQYQIGNPAIQQICLKGDGTWYGTTFNFSGHWINDPPALRDRAILYGNYAVDGGNSGFANDAFRVLKTGSGFGIDWFDWFDDMSYERFIGSIIFVRTKGNCDPPFTGENTHAATAQ